MSEHHHHRPASDHGGTAPSHKPYWTRAHTDRRLWVGVIVMFVAIIIYVMTQDLAWRPRSNPHPPQPTSAEGR